MKIVFDTNVLIAAFITRGVCADLLEHCIRQHSLVTSSYILKEFQETLTVKFKISRTDASEARKLIQSRMKLVSPIPVPLDVCRDPGDSPILGTALAEPCHCIVTGDKDLLELEEFEGVKIISPQSFWNYETRCSEK